jgi:hypothetical protein
MMIETEAIDEAVEAAKWIFILTLIQDVLGTLINLI